jgi:hypothetical membrane protein
MSTTTLTPTAGTVAPDCTPAQRVTRSLLGYGVLAGPVYVITSVVQALAHDGFDLTRHAWSQLAAGPQGWIQMANLMLSGAMVVAFAIGLRRSGLSRWAPRLIATYGLGLVASGMLVADPAAGYPAGVPASTVPTWHGIGHFVAGGIGFAAFIAACFVLARTFSRSGARRLAWWSRLTGIAFTAAFAGISSGSSSPAVILAFTAAVIAAWAWLAGIALHQYRSVCLSSRPVQ